jgi:hypothetical protein
LQGLIDTSIRTHFLTVPPQKASDSVFKVGDHVRVKPSVRSPAFGWGDVTHRMTGVIVSVENDPHATLSERIVLHIQFDVADVQLICRSQCFPH